MKAKRRRLKTSGYPSQAEMLQGGRRHQTQRKISFEGPLGTHALMRSPNISSHYISFLCHSWFSASLGQAELTLWNRKERREEFFFPTKGRGWLPPKKLAICSTEHTGGGVGYPDRGVGGC